jgi:hypothetical protein
MDQRADSGSFLVLQLLSIVQAAAAASAAVAVVHSALVPTAHTATSLTRGKAQALPTTGSSLMCSNNLSNDHHQSALRCQQPPPMPSACLPCHSLQRGAQVKRRKVVTLQTRCPSAATLLPAGRLLPVHAQGGTPAVAQEATAAAGLWHCLWLQPSVSPRARVVLPKNGIPRNSRGMKAGP